MTPLDMIATKLRKWNKKGLIANRLSPDLLNREFHDPLERIEIDTGNGGMCIFQADSILISGGVVEAELVRYEDICEVLWMAHEVRERAKMKRDGQLDKLIIRRADKSEVTVSGLGQSVFPLLHSLRWIAARNSRIKR